MKVERTGSASRSSGPRRASRSGKAERGAFAHELRQAAGSAPVSGVGPTGGLAPVEGVDALWALQEVHDVSRDSGDARERGNKLLDQLRDLQHALLIGTIEPSSLENLARSVGDRMKTVHDPELRDILAEIELRVEVELAKYGMIGKGATSSDKD